MSSTDGCKIPVRPRERKKIIAAVKSKGRIGDRAITDYTIAKEFGWTLEQIDRCDPQRLNELFVVMRTLNDQRKRDNDKASRDSKRKRGRRR